MLYHNGQLLCRDVLCRDPPGAESHQGGSPNAGELRPSKVRTWPGAGPREQKL